MQLKKIRTEFGRKLTLAQVSTFPAGFLVITPLAKVPHSLQDIF